MDQPESGKEYLARMGDTYLKAKKILPGLDDSEFQRVRGSKRDLDVGGFLMDFAVAAEEERRNLNRWTEGKGLPQAQLEHVAKVMAAKPAHLSIGTEALAGVRVESARQYRIDIVAEDIMGEIAKRLPRKIEAYRYHQDYAEDTIEVESLGTVRVKMCQSGNGVFSSISEIKGSNFRIWNCRDSGLKYLDRLNDISRPQDIEIKPLELEIELYSDDSGIYVGKNGKRFTNSRWQTAIGRGYSSDHQRDDLHRTWSGPNDMADPREGYVSNKGWREDKTVLSWKQTEDEAIVWLVDNVLNPVKTVPVASEQATTTPQETEFPKDKVGPLYTFVDTRDLERIAALKDTNSKNAYPDEKYGVRPGTRLISLNIRLTDDIPQTAYDSYIWCGVGTINKDTNFEELKYIGSEYRWDDGFMHTEGVAVVEPKTATDVYVINWQAWDDFRDRTFTETHDRLTNEEYAEMHRAVARTMVPITEYQGNYMKPIVVIGRDLSLDEIKEVHFPPKKESHK